MSSASTQRGLVAQMKRQPGKAAALGTLMLLVLVVWGPMLFGSEKGDDAPAPPSPNAALAATGGPAATSAPAATSTKTTTSKSKDAKSNFQPIHSFAEARKRLDLWRIPLGLEKAEPLTQELLAAKRAEAQLAASARAERTAAAMAARARAEAGDFEVNGEDPWQHPLEGAEPEVGGEVPEVIDASVEVELILTGTALLGQHRYAAFGPKVVQEGERIGRYKLKAVRSREVELVFDNQLTIVRMAPPEVLLHQPPSRE